MANTELLAAIQQRNPAQVATAIGHGAQPNAHDARGYTPFHVALLTADAPTVRALLESGADPMVTTKLAQGRNMGAKTLVAYRHGRAHAHPPGSRERDAEFAGCEAGYRLQGEYDEPAIQMTQEGRTATFGSGVQRIQIWSLS